MLLLLLLLFSGNRAVDNPLGTAQVQLPRVRVRGRPLYRRS